MNPLSCSYDFIETEDLALTVSMSKRAGRGKAVCPGRAMKINISKNQKENYHNRHRFGLK